MLSPDTAPQPNCCCEPLLITID